MKTNVTFVFASFALWTAMGIPLWSNGAKEVPVPVNDEPSVTRFVPQTLDTVGFNDVEYSADGSLVAGASISGTVKIWRTSDHLLVAAFKGYEDLTQVALSPDARLVALNAGNTLWVINIATGKVIYRESFSGPHDTWFLAFGKSSDVLVMADGDAGNNLAFPKQFGRLQSAVLRRISPVSKRSTQSASLPRMIPSCTFVSPKSGTMALGTKDGEVYTINPESLALTRQFKVPGRVRGLGLDPNGKWLVAADGELLRVDSQGTAKTLGELALYESDGFLPPASLSELGGVGLAYGPSRELVSFELRDGATVKELGIGHDGDRFGLAIHPRAEEFAVAQWDNPTGSPLYDLEGQNVDNRLGNPYWLLGGTQLADGRFIFSGSGQSNRGLVFSMNLIGLGEGMRSLQGQSPHAMKVLQRPGPTTLAFSNAGGYSLFHADRLTESSSFSTVNDRSMFEWINTISPDGRYLYFAREAGDQTDLVQRDLEAKPRVTDKVLGRLGGTRKGDIDVSKNGRLVFFPLGTSFLVYDNDKRSVVLKKDYWPSSNFANAMSSDGQLLALEDWESGAGTSILNASTGALVKRLAMTLSDGEPTLRRTFSEDGAYLAVSTPQRVFVYQTSNWELFKILDINGGDRGACLFFSRDGHYLVQGDSNGVINFANLEKGTVVRFIKTDTDWLFYTDDGYFEGSSNSGKMLALVQGSQAYAMDQLAVQYNRPDIVMERLGTERQNGDLYAFFRAIFQKRLARMGIKSEDLATTALRPVTTLTKLDRKGVLAHLELSFSGEDVSRFSVYVNDVPLFGQSGKDLSATELEQVVEFPLLPGENKIEASCFSAAGTESLRVLSKIDGPAPDELEPPELYYLGFGVSTYANSDLNLRYAHKDALDLESAFQSQTIGPYVQVHTKTFVNDQVQLDTMRQAKAFLAQARPQDTVILFIAGHGIFTKDSVAPDYFYISYNTDVTDVEHTAIRFSEIEDLLQGIPSRQKLFLMDTCNSGEVDPLTSGPEQQSATGNAARAVRGLTVTKLSANSKSKVPRTWLSQRDRYSQNDLIRRSGAIVFSSSKGGEYSYESDAIGNGMFTSALIKVLSGDLEARKDSEGYLTVRGLVEAVSAEVPHMTEDMQHPGVDRDNLSASFGLPLVDLSNRLRKLSLEFKGLPLPAGTKIVLKVGRTDTLYTDKQAKRVPATVLTGGRVSAAIEWWANRGLTVQLLQESGSPLVLDSGLPNDPERGFVVDPVEDAATLPPTGDTLVVDASKSFATGSLNGNVFLAPAFETTLHVVGLKDAAGLTVSVVGAGGYERPWETPTVDFDAEGTGVAKVRLDPDRETLTLGNNFVEYATLAVTRSVRKGLTLAQKNTVIWDFRGATPVITVNGVPIR